MSLPLSEPNCVIENKFGPAICGGAGHSMDSPEGQEQPSAAAAIVVTPPSGTLVPSGFAFVETAYEPNLTITPQDVAGLSDNDLLTGLKKQHKRTQAELDAFVVFFDEVVARFSEEQPRTVRGQFLRSEKPTLPEAFAAIGLSYETERKRKQRYIAAMKVRLAVPKLLQLAEGDTVKRKDKRGDAEYTVVGVHESAPKADVVPKDIPGSKVSTVPTDSLEKVKSHIKKIKRGDLLRDETGVDYQYVGNGKLSRTTTPTSLEQKRKRELIAIRANQEREQAKAEEKNRRDNNRTEEAKGRDLERIKKVKAQRQSAEQKKPKARAKKLERLAAKAKTKRSIKKEARARQVKVAHIDNTTDCGVFPESCFDYSSISALVIGTKEFCEADRDRRNALCTTNNNAVEDAHGAA